MEPKLFMAYLRHIYVNNDITAIRNKDRSNIPTISPNPVEIQSPKLVLPIWHTAYVPSLNSISNSLCVIEIGKPHCLEISKVRWSQTIEIGLPISTQG
ncbi:hypothetical protein F8M41_004228 [Gigaspora margarita]|uniref:Uncharacterized protein n=1 Tax=Gigaspora margarita TaxID=4874 RepID=A0A8H3XAQ8_GIGMA|nr:hypothetical protein F8M41_004228 [Gigaspora margarita]